MSCPVCNNKDPKIIGKKNKLTLVCCPICACVYVDPLPELRQLQEMYDDYLPTEKYLKKLRKKILTSRYKIFWLKRYQNSVCGNFLDVGCNIGATVKGSTNIRV